MTPPRVGSDYQPPLAGVTRILVTREELNTLSAMRTNCAEGPMLMPTPSGPIIGERFKSRMQGMVERFKSGGYGGGDDVADTP